MAKNKQLNLFELEKKERSLGARSIQILEELDSDTIIPVCLDELNFDNPTHEETLEQQKMADEIMLQRSVDEMIAEHDERRFVSVPKVLPEQERGGYIRAAYFLKFAEKIRERGNVREMRELLQELVGGNSVRVRYRGERVFLSEIPDSEIPMILSTNIRHNRRCLINMEQYHGRAF